MTANDKQIDGSHYKDMGDFQPWDVLQHWLTPEEYRGWQKGNAIVYLARERAKGGDKDIAKAAHHLEKLLEVLGQPEKAENPAVLMKSPIPENEGWIEVAGVFPNIPDTTLVKVLYRSGTTSMSEADRYRWAHHGVMSDIIAYKLVS